LIGIAAVGATTPTLRGEKTRADENLKRLIGKQNSSAIFVRCDDDWVFRSMPGWG
jgi:hypothetical protein